MLELPGPFTAHLAGRTTSLTIAYFVRKNDGTYLRGTAHDRDLTIDTGDFAGTYRARAAAFSTSVRANTDGSIGNVDVEGALRVDAIDDDISIADIEGGLYDQAPAVLFFLNWKEPNQGQRILCGGTLGEFYRDNLGRWRSEVRGLTQGLKQQLVKTYSERCNVRVFGDARCKFDVAAVTRTGTVTAVTNRKVFTATLSASGVPSPKYFDGARLLFTSGPNAGYLRETATVAVVGTTATITLWEEAADDIAIGNTISLPPACDRRMETCRDVHSNLVNFRGHGSWAVGRDRLIRGAT